MEPLQRVQVEGVEPETLAPLIIKLGNSPAEGRGLPNSAEILNDLPREEEKPGSDEEAKMGVRKMRVPSSEASTSLIWKIQHTDNDTQLLEKMKATSGSFRKVWTDLWPSHLHWWKLRF
ncbi:hypothetical protein E1B28_009670 [Marasmius oreades]|uniref:Uncharacterized protein n=1 Tax=Marasmius oreades TaxID=181124 RepID=A0A9P7RW86_9AGAR|nr:uncharacterized protein E1B28_009670 [Marasmius oreades]KAG7090562.1 hypothetical protein E1B28_009670 [Marasmius oreades]